MYKQGVNLLVNTSRKPLSEITQRPLSKCEMRNKVYFKALLSHSGNIQTMQNRQQIYKQQKSVEGLFKAKAGLLFLKAKL